MQVRELTPEHQIWQTIDHDILHVLNNYKHHQFYLYEYLFHSFYSNLLIVLESDTFLYIKLSQIFSYFTWVTKRLHKILYGLYIYGWSLMVQGLK